VTVTQALVLPTLPTLTRQSFRQTSSPASAAQAKPFATHSQSRCMQTTFDRLSARAAAAKSVHAVSSNEELLPGIGAIDSMNAELSEKLNVLRDQAYFRLYSIDMLASCEYIPQELFECYSETCEIYPIDDDEIPSAIKKVDADEHEFDMDGWARWDMPSEDYYDIEQFPEDYTGYDGSEVWRFIHNRICFKGYEYDDDHWKADFNKAVSGLHSMISVQIIRGIQEKIDTNEEFTEDEQWRDPVAEFDRRLGPKGETPLALENMYFCYMLLLTAASKARERLLKDCDSGKIDEDAANALRPILEHPLLDNPFVGAAYAKFHDHAVKDSDSVGALWEARMRSRELLRIMNCVQCNKCRLHGKISTMGLSTALQILVGSTGEGGDVTTVSRVELAALMETVDKFSRAIQTCKKMQS